jgi:hypothetical protein
VAKLTLSVDSGVISLAKQYAKDRGISISRLVEAYLAAVVEPGLDDSGDAPMLHSLRGSLKHADIGDYRKHMESKYR